MPWEIPANEREYLRKLAYRQAEIAALPIMAERKQMWYDLNDGKANARPPVVIETWTFDRDFMPADVYQCQSDAGRGVEAQILRNIRQHELINDDRVIADQYFTGWFVSIEEYGGVHIGYRSVADSQGVNTGFEFIHPIKDLRTDLKLLKPAICSVDKEGTFAYINWLDELIGDILPVTLIGGPYGNRMLTNAVVSLMSMEKYFLAMYDTPELLHELMAYLRDNAINISAWAENEGLLRLNNSNQDSFGSSFNYTTKLPAPEYVGPEARLCDMWGGANSQETVGVSPDKFHEFCFPYYRDCCEALGLLYYGCCEPVHPFWEDLKQIPHLKKLSISKWCDEKFMGEVLQGTGIVFSRKPDPGFLGVDVTLNEAGWADSVRTSLQATDGVPVEFIVRDVYTVHGNLDKPRRAVELAHQVIDEHFGA